MSTLRSICTFSLLVMLSLLPADARGAYQPDIVYSYFSGSSVPAVGVAVYTGGAVVCGGGQAWNASGVTAFLMVFDRTTAPSAGAAPIWQSPSCATATACNLSAIPPGGLQLTTGVYIAYSSSSVSYTAVVGSSTGYYNVGLR